MSCTPYLKTIHHASSRGRSSGSGQRGSITNKAYDDEDEGKYCARGCIKMAAGHMRRTNKKILHGKVRFIHS